MPMSPEHVEKLKAHINSKWVRKECVICLSNSWAIDGYTHLGISNVPTSMALGGQMLMLAAVTCKVCGNTVLVNLVAAGIAQVPNG